MIFANKLKGAVYGLELSSDWLPFYWWRMKLAYTYQRMNLRSREGFVDLTGQAAGIEGSSPRHQISWFNSIDLPGNVTFDAWLRYVDALPAVSVRSYFTVDTRLAWRPSPNLEISLVGQNLVDSSRREFVSVDGLSTRTQRGCYGKITYEF